MNGLPECKGKGAAKTAQPCSEVPSQFRRRTSPSLPPSLTPSLPPSFFTFASFIERLFSYSIF